MHLNYHFFKFLCPQLEQEWKGKALLSCFSQSKGELLLEFENSLWLRAHIKPPQVYLSFPEDFQRAKHNTQNWFEKIVGQRLQKVEAILHDRSMLLHFSQGDVLLLKMHANRSNILFYPSGADLPPEIFIKNLSEDRQLSWRDLPKNLDLSWETFQELEGNASRFLPSLGKIPRNWLKERGYPESDLSTKWSLILELLDLLESPLYSIIRDGLGYELSLLPEENFEKQIGDPVLACNELYFLGVVRLGFELEKKALLKKYGDLQKRAQSFVSKASAKLEELKSTPPPSQLADVVMANLHLFNQGKAEVMNFYTNETVEIQLPLGTKPQDYAEKLYKKSKNRKLEWQQLERNIALKKDELEQIELKLSEIESISQFRDLKKYLKTEKIDNPKEENQAAPFKTFDIDGHTVWVGKSAKANDEMLRHFVKKNDLWLHARDVSGSHVIIKQQGTGEVSEQLLEKAAALAAYYSKAKSQSLAPVIYTQSKYVRKVKGSPPGSVVVDKEKVILVEPKSPEALFGKD
ncbi:NFACT RNA binding domain-containing protein [Algoriphagus namhaensis]